MPGELEGQVALVTGGARGQGASHGRVLATHGAKVLLGDVLDEVGEAEAARQQADGLDVHYTHLDVTSEDDWKAAIELAESRFGSLNILLNNAGIVHIAYPEEETLEGFMQIQSVNSAGVFLGIKHAAAPMRRAGGGSIVNTASVYGINGAPAHIAYNASKAAVRMMTKVAAIAYADDNIRVNTMSPGVIITEQSAEEIAIMEARKVPRQLGAKTLVKEGGKPRPGTLDEMSAAVLFLVSPGASFVNGTEIVVDGGATAW